MPVLLVLAMSHCTLDREGHDVSAGPGGASGWGGTPATGGTSGTSGAATGGTTSTGGTTNTGGTGATGGSETGGDSGAAGIGATGGDGGSAAGGNGGGGNGGAAGAAGSGGTATGGTGGGPVFDPPWWDAAWNHRWPIVVTNHSTSSLGAGFQLPLPVVDGTGPVAAIDTWRVLYWNGGTWDDLPRVVEHVGDTAWVWFRTREQIDASTTGEGYWLYTGNPGAAVPPFADGVFEFYSAVDPIDSAKWATIGNVSTDGGMAKLDGSGAGASIRSLTTFEVRSVVEFAMIVDAPVASGGWWFCGGFQRQNDFTNSSPWILWISRSGTQLDTEFYNGSGISWKGANVGIDPGVEHLYGIERFRRKLVFRRDHQDFETYTFGSEYTTPLQIRFSAYADSVIRLRWARVRRARDPAPTATLGAPESLP